MLNTFNKLYVSLCYDDGIRTKIFVSLLVFAQKFNFRFGFLAAVKLWIVFFFGFVYFICCISCSLVFILFSFFRCFYIIHGFTTNVRFAYRPQIIIHTLNFEMEKRYCSVIYFFFVCLVLSDSGVVSCANKFVDFRENFEFPNDNYTHIHNNRIKYQRKKNEREYK